ncbi:hypothetical protein [Alistipes shahii]|jgi:hypothetical protein|uniref:hypothetical protein n=1 Tax=Alistipes shahii TaxID=328814 RepID=UPI0034A525DD
MDYQNNGYQRSLQLIVKTIVNGQETSRSSYDGRLAFSHNGNSYTSINNGELMRMPKKDYNQRLTDFIDYVENIVPGLHVEETLEPGYAPRRQNTTACPLNYALVYYLNLRGQEGNILLPIVDKQGGNFEVPMDTNGTPYVHSIIGNCNAILADSDITIIVSPNILPSDMTGQVKIGIREDPGIIRSISYVQKADKEMISSVTISWPLAANSQLQCWFSIIEKEATGAVTNVKFDENGIASVSPETIVKELSLSGRLSDYAGMTLKAWPNDAVSGSAIIPDEGSIQLNMTSSQL